MSDNNLYLPRRYPRRRDGAEVETETLDGLAALLNEAEAEAEVETEDMSLGRRYPRRRDDDVGADAPPDESADASADDENEESSIIEPASGIVLASDMAEMSELADLLGVDRRSDIETHNWQIDFGPAWGPAGSVTTIRMKPQCYFRVEKIMATDTSAVNGMGTQIISVLVGNKLQRGTAVGGTQSLLFSQNALGNGVKWDVGEPAHTISVTVRYLVTCTFFMTTFGTEWRK